MRHPTDAQARDDPAKRPRAAGADRGRALYTLAQQLFLSHPIADVFAFFADAQNLQTLTPPWLNFRILTPMPIDIREGTLIDYRLQLHGLPIKWRTLIRDWQPPHRFVDEQLRGPYRTWIHEHTFESHEGGTLCRDHVTYDVPGGPLRPLVHRLFVQRQVQRIFDYRADQLRRRFTGMAASPAAV